MKHLKILALLMGIGTTIFIILPGELKAAKLPKHQNRIVLTIHFRQATESDTLTLEVGNKFIGVFIDKPEIYLATKNKDGLFRFVAPVWADYGYFQILVKRKVGKKQIMINKWIVEPQFWEKGDNLTIDISSNDKVADIQSVCQFKGVGSAKYQARYVVQQIANTNERAFNGNLLTDTSFAIVTSSAKNKLASLETFKLKMSALSYNVLKADIYFNDRESNFQLIQQYYKKLEDDNNLDSLKLFKKAFKKKFGNESLNQFFSSQGLENSVGYLIYAYRKGVCIMYLEHGAYSTNILFNSLVDNFSGNIREVMLLYYFKSARKNEKSNEEFRRAEMLTKDKQNLKLLNMFKAALPGRKLMDYSFTNLRGEKINLADFDNKVVFLDFWFTGCGYCSELYKKTLSRIEDKFKGNSDVVFISICVDYETTRWKEGLNSGEYTSVNAVNVFTNGEAMKHPIISDNNITGYPTVILLQKGRILHSFNTESLYIYDSLLKEINLLL